MGRKIIFLRFLSDFSLMLLGNATPSTQLGSAGCVSLWVPGRLNLSPDSEEGDSSCSLGLLELLA